MKKILGKIKEFQIYGTLFYISESFPIEILYGRIKLKMHIKKFKKIHKKDKKDY